MGILKGSIAVRRFAIRGTPPEGRAKLVKGIRAHAFAPIDPQSELDRSYGWVALADSEQNDLQTSDIFVGDSIALTLRVDTLRPPTSQVKRLLKESLAKLPRKPTSKDKRDAKDLAIRTLRKRAFPASKTYEVVWRLEDQRVLSFTTSKTVTALLVDLFGKSFGCELEPLGPTRVAQAALGDLPEALEPTAELIYGFGGLPGRPTAADVEAGEVAA
jgi:DNA recombination-dependent growth factor C